MTTREEIFGGDELSVKATNAFANLRNVQMKYVGWDRADDTFTYIKFDGQTAEYTIGGLMECDEFVDFVRGYKGMCIGSPSESYKQGKESVK